MVCKNCGGTKWVKVHTQWCNYKGQSIIAKLFRCDKCESIFIALDSALEVAEATKAYYKKKGKPIPSPKKNKVVEKLTSEELAVRKKQPKLNIKKDFETIKKTGGVGNYGY